MKLRFECREPTCPALIEYHPTGSGVETFDCPRCQRSYTLHDTAELSAGRTPATCTRCRGEEFFKRKDFPQKTGLAIVLIAAVISLMTLRSHPWISYGVLALAVVIDLLIYQIIGVVLVCYRCRTEFWGLPAGPTHEWFDLATSEKYL